MIRKRSVYDPLEPTREPRWLEILDRHSRLLESRALPPGADLKRVFIVAMLEHIDAGWKLGEFGSRLGAFFCDRDNERRQVAIVAVEPGKHVGYGAAHLAWSPDRGEWQANALVSRSAVRIKARTVPRSGQLAKQIEPSKGGRPSKEAQAGAHPSSRKANGAFAVDRVSRRWRQRS